MVKVQPRRVNQKWRKRRNLLMFIILALVVVLVWISIPVSTSVDIKHISESNQAQIKAMAPIESPYSNKKISKTNSAAAAATSKSHPKLESSCSYKALSDLKPYEEFPIAHKDLDGNGRRHLVDPPKDGKVTLVCCETSAGPMSVAVHHNWAPLGAQRFLDMVRDEYFSSKVAMMRCVKNFLCQFGIAGIPSLNKKYDSSLQDDPNWLPEGPTHMTNEFGAKRYAKGYFAYAGSGKNSRGNQLIVALNDHKRLGGGSPWEVPFGEVVGADSFATLAAISTVYGEKGPSQGLLRREGSSENVAQKFPKLDYMTSCAVIDEGEINI